MIKTLLNFVLIVLIFASTVGYTLNKLQDPTFVIDQARQVNLYGRTTSFLPSLVERTEVPGLPLTDDDRVAIATSAINGEAFYDLLSQYLTFHLRWFNGKEKKYQFSYDFTQVKNRAEQKTTEILLLRYSDLPVCKSTQLRDWDAATSFPSCKLNSQTPPEPDVVTMISGLSKNFVHGTGDNGKELLPSTLSLSSPSEKMLQARTIISTINRAIRAVWLLSVLFLALYIFILRKRAFFSLAFIFIVVGLLQVGFSYIAWDWLVRTLVDLLASTELKDMIVIINEVVSASIEVLKTIMGSLSIISLAIGGTSLIIGIITHIRKPKILPI